MAIGVAFVEEEILWTITLNNKLPKNLDEAFEEVKNKPAATEPDWIWPESHAVESAEPLIDQGGLKA